MAGKGQDKLGPDVLLETVNAASARAQNAWLFFLGISAFLFITISSVTHATLLLDTPVRLPLFQVNMRAYAFFLVAPVIYVLVHVGILVQHRTLLAKLTQFNAALGGRDADHPHRHRLSIYTYAQFLAGPERAGGFAMAIAIIAWLTLSVLPLLLLAYFQASFLPYHSQTVTWANRLTLLADALAILFAGLFRTRLGKPGAWRGSLLRAWQRLKALPKALRHFRQTVPRAAAALWQGLCLRLSRRQPFIATLNTTFAWLAVFYAFLVATVPGEHIDQMLCAEAHTWCRAVPWNIVESTKDEQKKEPQRVGSAWFITPAYGWGVDVGGWGGDSGCCSPTHYAFFPTAWLFERGTNLVSGLSNSPLGLARTLIITNTVLNREGRVSLRGRDLRYATLTHVTLRHADFTGTDLTHAGLSGSDLTGARFGCADTGRKKQVKRRQGKEEWKDEVAKSACTNLLHADFSDAVLDGTQFSGGWRNEPLVHDANGETAAYLASAVFSDVSLKGAVFENLDMSGWSFSNAALIGAAFKDVIAPLADFSGADLRGARFSGAGLSAAMLADADLSGVTFSGALDALAADFSSARLWKTRLPSMDRQQLHDTFRFAHLSGVRISPPDAGEAADLRKTIAAIADEALRARVRQRLVPVLDKADWKEASRDIWQVLTGKGDTECNVEQDRQWLKMAEARARALAARFCKAGSSRTGVKTPASLRERIVSFVADKWLPVQLSNSESGEEEEPDSKPPGDGEKNESHALRDSFLLRRLQTAIRSGKLPAPQSGQKEDGAYYYLVDIPVFRKACGLTAEKLKDEAKQYAKWKADVLKDLQSCAGPQEAEGKTDGQKHAR